MKTLLALVTGENMMKLLFCQYVFTAALFVLNKQWAKAVYWIGAAIINVSVQWMK